MVFGEPALAVAIDLRTTVNVKPSDKWTVNQGSLDDPHQRYKKAAVQISEQKSPLEIHVESTNPEGSGMGSSAAVVVATLGAIHNLRGKLKPETIARQAFDTEHAVQGRASPIDTSTCVHGHAVLVLRNKGSGFLWRMERGDHEWYLHHRDMPTISLVAGLTGIKGPTGPLVAKVQEFAKRSSEAREMISEIGHITLEATDAIADLDWKKVGGLMDRNHELLNALGVGHELLERYVKAARPYSFGAKLTGAGGGGSMIALTEEPEKAAEAIKAEGGRAFIVRTGEAGMTVVD